MTDIFATEAIEQARAAVDVARAAYDAATAKVDAFGPMPLLGTDAEIDEHATITAAARVEQDAAMATWSAARKSYDAELHSAFVASQGYDNVVADVEAM